MRKRRNIKSKIINVRASDDVLNKGFRLFRIPEDGWYSISLIWLNDKWECTDPYNVPPDPCDEINYEWYDANIMIDSVFFDKIW